MTSQPAADARTLLLVGFHGTDPASAAPIVRDLRPGGLVLVPRNIVSAHQVADLVGGLQAVAAEEGLPELLIAIDHEGGEIQRLTSELGFTDLPSAHALGRSGDVETVRRLATVAGRELASVGVNLDLAPVADLVSDAGAGVIGTRSFGSDPAAVAQFVAAVIEGLRGAGVLACAKHFPGHGPTDADSHIELPRLEATADEMRARDLAPFRSAIAARCAAIMTAHVISPIDPEVPATLSRVTLVHVLRRELGFEGLVLTDALEMKALAGGRLAQWQAAAEALRAGADVLVFEGTDRALIDRSVAWIDRQVESQELDPAHIERSRERWAAARRSLAEGRQGADATPIVVPRGTGRRGSAGTPLDLVVPAHAPAGQLVVTLDGVPLFDAVAGSPIDNDARPIGPDTLFDLASVTKLFTALAFMALVERGRVALDGRVVDVLPSFGAGSSRAKSLTWRHLLTHTSGLPAALDLPDGLPPAAARARALAVAPDAQPGPVVYSDVGFMDLGFAIEEIWGTSLEAAVSELVSLPADLPRVHFRPGTHESVAPTEYVPARGGRLLGSVHDENAAALGGVAGHAGLFATAADLARLGVRLLQRDGSVVSSATLDVMTSEQAVDGGLRRGLGFSLWSPDPEATSHPLGPRSFGHTGYTGTSLWVDPERRLVIAFLTNAVFRGRDFEAFFAARIRAHREIVAAADAVATRRRVEAAP